MSYFSQATRTFRRERGETQHESSRSVTDVIAQGIYLVVGIIEGLLGLRLLLSLLGANQSNTFASFIYEASRPLVTPFFGLFNYQPQIGIARFEIETLIAMIVYSFVALLLVRIATIGPRNNIEV